MSALLAIDTSAPRLQLAVLVGDWVDVSIDDIAQGHAELLFPRLNALLARNNLGFSDLSRIAVTSGPGSFTGLRIGLSAARGLGLALGVPVLGIPTLFALSLAAEPSRPVDVLLDARRDEAYFQPFSSPGKPRDRARLLPMEMARHDLDPAATLITSPFADMAALARFAEHAAPADFPPEASYIRSADAKPQDKARLPRQTQA
jgi:tRNA threonylcarbamoyladenosine biosynthesis protein TsaB